MGVLSVWKQAKKIEENLEEGNAFKPQSCWNKHRDDSGLEDVLNHPPSPGPFLILSNSFSQAIPAFPGPIVD